MEKITDKIAALPRDSNYFSLEFFPPKTQTGFANLQTRLERMSSGLRPLFVNVTWGAGGSTATRSLELAEICQRQLGLTTCLHLTCTNMKRRMIDDALHEAKALGIRNILALRGDPPRSEEYRLDAESAEGEDEDDSNKDFTWAIDLVRHIRRVHGNYFCIGVAGYPEGHADESHPTDQDPAHDLPYLIDKTKAGADFIMTQLFYNLDAYAKYEKLLREHESGVFATMPIIPGLMPIQSYEILERTTKLAHVKVPPKILESLERVKGDDDAVKQVGIDIMSDMVKAMKKLPGVGPRAFHFFTLNLEKAVSEILERCNLIPSAPSNPESTSAVDDTPLPNGVNGSLELHRRTTSSASSAEAQLTTNSHRTSSIHHLTVPTVPTHPKPRSSSREATWDDYPNGHYSDPRSPAFNPPLSYSPTSLSVSPTQALELWGTPTTTTDLTNLFLLHLSNSQPPQLPWSESGNLSPETELIKSSLESLTSQKSYWTIASQPSVDGLPSTHATHGWGPAGGFVFQKSFVEFFIPSSAFHSDLKPRLDRLSTAGDVAFYAVDAAGNFHSSEEPDRVHAVTWGSFKAKEIVTATMVEEVSFRTWGEEAFAIWAEWGRCVGYVTTRQQRRGLLTNGNTDADVGTSTNEARELGRRSREFLDRTRRDVWLVNVIGHAYMEKERLWEVLLE